MVDKKCSYEGHMKVTDQTRNAALKGNQTLGLIRRSRVYNEMELIIPLCKIVVRRVYTNM